LKRAYLGGESIRASVYFLAALLMVAGSSSVQGAAPADEGPSKEAERLTRAAEVFKEIMEAPDQTIPRDLLDRSCCIVVIPTMVKAGFVFGGRYGKGAVACRKDLGAGAWGPPSMVTLGGGSFGLQIGGAAVDVIMLVMNPSGLQSLLKDKVTLGGDMSAAAGPVGRAATAETDAMMNAKILTYSRSRGLFAGLELKGAALFQDRDANRSLYHRRVQARELLLEGAAPIPPEARQFIEQLTKASPTRNKKPL
jgi:lipid-binding SYLF domain-containing protein